MKEREEREQKRESERKREREGGREGGRERGREGASERGREGGRERVKIWLRENHMLTKRVVSTVVKLTKLVKRVMQLVKQGPNNRVKLGPNRSAVRAARRSNAGQMTIDRWSKP